MPLRLTEQAHRFIEPAIRRGAIALDATTGTGADTAFLALGVGAHGMVRAFDVQCDALRRARQRLEAAGLADRVVWHRACHATLARYTGTDRFCAAMFNLGWLPGSTSDVVTHPETTRQALTAAARHLEPGGRLSVLVYRGHAGGPEEHAAVEQWVRNAAHGLLRREWAEAPGGRRPGPVFFGLERPPEEWWAGRRPRQA